MTEGTENAVRVKLARAGLVTLRGPGAGGRETAAAVVSDILSLRCGGLFTGAPFHTKGHEGAKDHEAILRVPS